MIRATLKAVSQAGHGGTCPSIYSPSTWEPKAGESKVQGQLQSRNKSQASLGYSPPQKNKGEEGARFSLYVSCVSNFNLYMNRQGPYKLNKMFIHHM